MNRGQSGRHVFRDNDDRIGFLDLVAECAIRWDIRTAAFCLMANHYHLLLFDKKGNLSRAMRHIDGIYTQRFNRRHRRDGSLMRGRFRSRIVQEERYLLEVIRYIHTNAVRTKQVSRADKHDWNSHRYYLKTARPTWLLTEPIMELIGDDDRKGRKRFDQFVHEKIEAEVTQKLEPRRWVPVLGDDKWAQTWRKSLRKQGRGYDREIPDEKNLSGHTIEDILQAACDVFKVDRDELVYGKRGMRNIPRLLTILICRDTTQLSAKEISIYFGISAPTVSVLAGRGRDLTHRDRSVAKALKALESRLDKNKKQDET